MNLNFKKCSFGEVRTVLDTTADNPFDFDVTLPDYFPDIQRVLKCTVTPGITSSVISAGRASADGSALLRVIYSSDNKRIYCYEQSFSFGKSVEDSVLRSDASLISTVKTDFVNCRATGQRKLNIQGVISIRFSVRDRVERDIICGCDDENIQYRSKKLDMFSTVGCSAGSFLLSEVTKLPDGFEPVDKILSTSAGIIADSSKAVSGKILVKGDLTVDVIYTSENDSSSSVTFTHTMPISQIIESEGASEESVNDVRLKISNLAVVSKNDANGISNQLEFTARVDAFVVSEQKMETDIINDAYSMRGMLKGKFENVGFKTASDKISDVLNVTKSFDLGADGISALVASWCSGIRHSYSIKGNELTVNGKITVMILFLNSDGEPAVTEKESEFEYVKKLSGVVDNIYFDPMLQVGACRCTLGSENGVSLKAEIIINGTVYSYVNKKILTDAVIDDVNESADKNPGIVIYFAEDGEDIWDIAGRYKTTVDSIKTENELKDSVIKERKMIVIPSAN